MFENTGFVINLTATCGLPFFFAGCAGPCRTHLRAGEKHGIIARRISTKKYNRDFL
ncbi:hypothetical protein HBDW_14520 [Herbaspirillum sp. DW155]|uniref:hypothetical protein n=1 Tax=Herbaspirillum sp. DW155 TaxID=3095609 RepID=UPI003087AF21|nr:hypothetical protein HBDW_14520 [Herbaspirillum sp. DW155]